MPTYSLMPDARHCPRRSVGPAVEYYSNDKLQLLNGTTTSLAGDINDEAYDRQGAASQEERQAVMWAASGGTGFLARAARPFHQPCDGQHCHYSDRQCKQINKCPSVATDRLAIDGDAFAERGILCKGVRANHPASAFTCCLSLFTGAHRAPNSAESLWCQFAVALYRALSALSLEYPSLQLTNTFWILFA